MSFSINTNVTSLQAQNYLRINSNFQSKTIGQVTSGLRIVTSGDDAAGLAIANSDRSNEAVLTQGVHNANDGLSSLQIADGGISNISQLLDRARTLATQSASGTLTGTDSRNVLNSEFQSVLTEINRQAQAIGLNQGGQFAQNLQVFVGGGQASGSNTAIQNGTVSVDLSKSAVDAKSLGLEGVQATGALGGATTDIGTGSTTSVQTIIQNATNLASISNNTTNFSFTGPGFSDTTGSNTIDVAVNLTGVTNTDTLVTALNAAIQNAGNGASQQATAFRNAGVTASASVNSAGQTQLSFSSGTTAFQVQGDDKVATALLGDFKTTGSPTVGEGNSAQVTATAGAAWTVPTAAASANVRIAGAGLTGTQGDFAVALATTDTETTAIAAINTAIAGGSAALVATGIHAQDDGAGKIQLVGSTGQSFNVQTSGDISNSLGFGASLNSTGTAGGAGTFSYSAIGAAGGAGAAKTQGIAFSVNGGPTIDLGVLTSTGATNATATVSVATINTAIQANSALRASGITASLNTAGTGVQFSTAATGVTFRLDLYGGTGDAFGLGASNAASTAATSAATASSYAAKDSINSSGAQSSVNGTNGDVYQFNGLTSPGQTQTITLSANDASGNAHSLNIALTSANAGNLDQALSTINSAIAASNDTTLGQVAGLKEVGSTSGSTVNGVEGIRFLSAGAQFKVSLGASQSLNGTTSTTNTAQAFGGLSDGQTGLNGTPVLTSAANGTGATADISNISTAQAAVAALASAVSTLGNAQAVVGRGENQFNYAVNLASSQLTNTAAAEANIRDANMATESANLTKASILLQAGIAALAQANSAPQQILKLLQQ